MMNYKVGVLISLCVTSSLASAQSSTSPSTVVFNGRPALQVERLGRETVTDAPVTAQFKTRMVQELADGNTIVREHTSTMWRDSHGRVRREVEAAQPTSRYMATPVAPITISDPVAGHSLVLIPGSRVALKHSGPRTPRSGTTTFTIVDGQSTLSATTAGSAAPASAPIGSLSASVSLSPQPADNTVFEDLGEKEMQGVRVHGTRQVTTIPAGAIGNSLPIVMTRENWFSERLQVVIRSEYSDPRTGSVSYEATILSTQDPDPTLFVVPDGYTLQDGPFVTPLIPARE
ncbi:MAG: hypothetical protein AAFX10_11430 [Pseudomonadota bacterium]